MADTTKPTATAGATPATAPERESKRSGKIAVQSMTGQARYAGTYIIPAEQPLVLDLSKMADRDLGEIEGDAQLFKLRSDAAVTKESDIVRYKRA
jgi:hypothetical protein